MTKEVLKMALEALYPIAHNTTDDPRGQAYKAITAIKEALANHIEDNLVMVTRGDAWRKQLTSAQRNELKQIEDGTWEADRNG